MPWLVVLWSLDLSPAQQPAVPRSACDTAFCCSVSCSVCPPGPLLVLGSLGLQCECHQLSSWPVLTRSSSLFLRRQSWLSPHLRNSPSRLHSPFQTGMSISVSPTKSILSCYPLKNSQWTPVFFIQLSLCYIVALPILHTWKHLSHTFKKGHSLCPCRKFKLGLILITSSH